MRHVSKITLAFFTILLMMCSCKKKLTGINSTEAEGIQTVLNSQTDDGISKSGKSNAEKEWRKLYKTCGKTFTFDNPVFLGLSNNKGVGLMFNKDNGQILRLPPLFSSQDSANFITVGAVVPICTTEINKSFDINLLFNAIFQSVAVDSFGASFSRSTSKIVTAGNWYQVDVARDAFQEYVSSRKELESYKLSMDKEDSYVVTSALYVSSFSADLNYDTEASLGLRLKTDSVYKAPFISGKGQIGITYRGDKKIHITCDNLFVPLAVLSKIE